MARSFAHWTPRYFVDKLWLRIHEKLHPDDPWLTKAAIQFLDDNLQLEMVGVECGSGRSTVWIARRIQSMLSVEHSSEWYQKVSLKLNTLGLTNVTYHLQPDPDHYVEELTRIPDSSVDFMLVDGIERDRCFEEGIRIVKPGGLLVLDNSNWYLAHNTYSPASVPVGTVLNQGKWPVIVQSIRNWRYLWTSNGITDTAIFLKPQR